jgi:hypothetical protein
MLIPGSMAFTLRRKVGLPQSGAVMSGDHEQRIRTRAYEIWERDGHPEGRAEAHWRQARIEIDQELATSGMQLLACEQQRQSLRDCEKAAVARGTEPRSDECENAKTERGASRSNKRTTAARSAGDCDEGCRASTPTPTALQRCLSAA